VGIEPAQLGEIFREFYQVENPQRDRDQGLGLGLAIVERTAKLLDHPITVPLASRPRIGVLHSRAPRRSGAGARRGTRARGGNAHGMLRAGDRR
jgi:hypothetical protein